MLSYLGLSALLTQLTESFRSLLPSDYDFTFVDGPTTCKPDGAIAKVYPGPYLCWYRTPTTESVTAAHRHVKSIMAEKGPFDGIMGFSQVSLTESVPSFSYQARVLTNLTVREPQLQYR